MQPYSDRLRGFLTTRPGIAQRSPALLTAKPIRIPSVSPVAERIGGALDRQHDAVARANVTAFNAKLRIELLSRMAWQIPLHEWSEAKRRGADAVRLLLEAYMPGNEAWMASAGLTPRCPPWASRRYRAPARSGELVGERAGASL